MIGILPTILLGLALGLGPAGDGVQGATETCAVAPSGATGIDGDLERFLGLLASVRGGDEEAGVELLSLASHLGGEHARADCADVARYYVGLSSEARAEGLADEEEFFALRQEVVRAGEDEGTTSANAWEEESSEILGDLVALGERVRRKSDFAPAARAFALAARLETELAETSGEGREELLASASEHAAVAIDLFARAGQVTPQLEPLWVTGRIQRALGHGAKAGALFEECAELAHAVRRTDFEAHAIFGMIALARDRGDVHEVDRLLSRAARVTTPAESWPLAREHAVRLLHSDCADAALSFLDRNPPADSAWQDEWRALRGAAFLRRGDLPAARAEIDQLEEDARGEIAILSCASIELADGNAQAVIDVLGVPGAMDGFSWLGQAQGASLLGEACLAGGQVEHAVPWLEVALERATGWAALQEDQSPGSVFGEWIGLHTVVLLAEAHARAGRALRAACVIEAHQSQGLRRSTGRDGELQESELLAWAANHELGLLTWCVGADRSIAIHVAGDGTARASVLPRGRRVIEEAVRRLREAATAGAVERAHALAADLSQALLPASFVDELSRASADDRALWLLHGPLERLPISLLVVGSSRLVDHCTPLVLPGLPELAAPAAPSGEWAEWHLLGAPTAADQHQILPGAARELSALARIHPRARLTSGSSFTHDAVAAALGSGAPLHLATHLVPSERCEATRLAPVALLLAGEDHFCAAEVLAAAPRSPLVVLSTCESGGGRFVDAEGLQGLARAFLESGTRNLLVTLWPIEDAAAARAAELFHERLLEGDRPSAAARSMVASLAREGYSMADWAAYRFIGRD